jgi:hypothetical protein
MKRINDNFDISEGATFKLVNPKRCKITSRGTLGALTSGFVAQSCVSGAVVESTTLCAIVKSWEREV